MLNILQGGIHLGKCTRLLVLEWALILLEEVEKSQVLRVLSFRFPLEKIVLSSVRIYF